MATLSEADSKALLARHGVAVLDERVVATSDAAVAAAVALGFPVVVKLCGEAIAHKTERGLVRLGLDDAASVRAASVELLARATPDDGAVGLLVAPMVRGTRELIAGLVTDAQFGPCVMLGVGGVLAEALGDVVFRLAPIQDRDAYDMLNELRTAPLLGAFRGEPPVDRGSVAAVLLALSALAADDPSVRSVDVNPLLVRSRDGRAVAVDALVERA